MKWHNKNKKNKNKKEGGDSLQGHLTVHH